MSDLASRPIVSTVELRRTYGEGETAVHALQGITTSFPTGQYAAIMGPSGSGKSTLMHLLAGLDRPTAGSVVVDGKELANLDDRELTRLRRDRLGFVFQAFNLVPVLTAEENILLPLTLAGRKPDREWVTQLIDTVGLGDRLDHRPAELSGGQQQRVAVARALIHRPAVVFADRQPRLALVRRGARPAAPGRRRVRADRRDGHARPAFGLRGRPHRRAQRRADHP
jgi:putative ABC transport system ATP-binding protein